MTKYKTFHLGDVLSITTGKLLSKDKMDGVYSILNFMTGEILFVWQLPRAADCCKPVLLEYHPELKGVDFTQGRDFEPWLEEQCNEYGEFLDVPKLPKGVYTPVAPLIELSEMLCGTN
jgi:hypothetical protein